VALYLGDAAEAVAEHALVPLRVERLGARLKPHHLGERADACFARERVGEVDGRARLRVLLDGAGDAAEVFEVVVNVRDAYLERVNVLVGRLDARERA
jgi:hypothetical protein